MLQRKRKEVTVMEQGSGGDGERLFYGWWPGKGSVIGSVGYGSEGVMGISKGRVS